MSLISQNYFVLLGLPQQYQQCLKKIKDSYIKLQQEIHPDRYMQSSEQAMRLAVDYAAQINQAYRTLLDPVLRAIYILKCRGIKWDNESSVALPIEFLCEQMEFREKLAGLKQNPNDFNLENMKKSIEAHITALTEELQQSLDFEPTNNEIAALCVRKMQFYAKLLGEIEALESVCLY